MRNYYILLMVVLSLAACSGNEIADNRLGLQQITFSNLHNKVTRSANTFGDDYTVYAKSSLSGETEWYIRDVINGKTDTPKNGSVYYWPGGSYTVSFFAWAPSTVMPADQTYDRLSINYTVPQNAQEDFTVASPVEQSSGNVGLLFMHMLSKISVVPTLSSSLTAAGYALDLTKATTELRMNSNAATIDVTASSPTWINTNNKPTLYSGENSYLVLPQSSLGCTVQLKNIRITKGNWVVFSGDLKMHTIATSDIANDSFQKGKHYQLTFTITNLAKEDNDNDVFGPEIQFGLDLVDWSQRNTNPGVPAFKGIIAIGSDGRLTLNGHLDPLARTVYFKFGSVIGIATSPTYKAWQGDGSDVLFNPTTNNYIGDYSLIATGGSNDITEEFHRLNVSNGLGDPCRLVGLTMDQIMGSNGVTQKTDNGLWRLPTRLENEAIVIGAWTHLPFPGREQSIPNNNSVFLPAAGYRAVSGAVYESGLAGNYVSSTSSSSDRCYSVFFTERNPNYINNSYQSYGYTVRCVHQ